MIGESMHRVRASWLLLLLSANQRAVVLAGETLETRTPIYARDDVVAKKLDAGKELLDLLKNPFEGTMQQASIWSALAVSIGFTVFLSLCFSFLRPYNQAVYAPKSKHADEKHAPPTIGKKPWSWLPPLIKTKEKDLVARAGMDAAVFMRFTRMCRNIFLTLTVLGCGILIPVHVKMAEPNTSAGRYWLSRVTPVTTWGEPHWAQVAFAYLMNITVAGYLWFNYRKVVALRQEYFNSEEFQSSLHARTLMLNDIPRDRASDEGIARLIDEVAPSSSFARTAIARNVRDLPSLIAEHDKLVRKLEKVLATYLKNPNELPPNRPTCRPSKGDPSYSTYPKNEKLDAIDYLTERIRGLEIQVREVRSSVDKRNTMPYGFASYSDISEAHQIAFTCRHKKPGGTTIKLAPRPNDIIWDNMALTPAARSWKGFMNNIWVTILTVVWIAPNAMIAIFLVNLSNLGRLWDAFDKSLQDSPTFWGMFQGVANPALTSLIYLVLPIIFRRLAIASGDWTKTGRERHVLAKLYAFFVFNNLIVFSIFSTVYAVVAGVVKDTSTGTDTWQAILKNNPTAALFESLCGISPFWVNWLLQRQLGAAIDLAQLWPLIWSFCMRKFTNPTPRELIEMTAPPPFEYAAYYNYFLYYATVTFFYSGIQPLVLPAAAFYFLIDVLLKKYLILYVFVTKTESGGVFWRTLFNRMIFAVCLADLVFILTTYVRGLGTHVQAYAVCPLPIFMIMFKFYCKIAFDKQIKYYSAGAPKSAELADPKNSRLRSEKLASRFGHPAIYKPLITPMVHQAAQDKLHLVYQGRVSDGRGGGANDMMSVSGYSETVQMDSMSSRHPGKADFVPGFEYVSEAQMDFEYYKTRPEFNNEFGGAEIYGAQDISRPDTPGSMFAGSSYAHSDLQSRPGTPSQGLMGGMTGGRRYDGPPAAAGPSFAPYRGGSATPAGYAPPQHGYQPPPPGRSPLYMQTNDSSSGMGLMSNAASMGYTPPMAHGQSPSVGGAGEIIPPGNGPMGYSGVAQSENPYEPSSQYQQQYPPPRQW